jgi:hypothetical protein
MKYDRIKMLRIIKTRLVKWLKAKVCEYKGHKWTSWYDTGYRNNAGYKIKVRYCARCPKHEENP